MSRKISFFLLILILIVGYSCSGKSNKKTKDPETDTTLQNRKTDIQTTNDSSWINQVQFGYSNERGDLILADSTMYPTKPASLIYALDSSGNRISITYEEYRGPGKNDTGRQIYFNFENASGCLYSSTGILDAHQTILLFTEEFFSKRTSVKLTRTDKKGLPENVKKKVETDKSRKIKTSREIASLDNAGTIYLMEFGRKKDSALASLVLVYNDNYTYYDFPALYDEQSTWRVDDGGEFWLDGIEILAVFKQGETIELIFDWVGAEGYNTQYLQQNGAVFKEIKTNYRYTSPI